MLATACRAFSRALPRARPRTHRTTAPATMATAAVTTEAPVEVFRKDYKPPAVWIRTTHLSFVLDPTDTTVVATLGIERNSDKNAVADLVLDGDESIKLESVELGGKTLALGEGYTLSKAKLTIPARELPESTAELVIRTRINPKANTALEGLYNTGSNFCTQCEAEGFRRITYYLDRPDVMSKYTTRIEADKATLPVLLSNGNLIESGDLEGGKHFTVWEDPFVKPCYLFALVAGDYACISDSFTTASGKEVALAIYVEKHNADKADWAMVSLKKSMKWDEETYGLEYDLGLFNIVAVDDFNMGAMENKSLNIFNSKLVLATAKTATDSDYFAIESVVAHEYFHNWTGNRVTCRDWFQLSLKEGLTVYRDQEFSADMNSAGVVRIDDVAILRNAQFPQDSGPMAHPVRPDSYIKMDNFYTVTVYNKGAEVVRMYEALFGKTGFRKGMDLYFKRHDGCAVECDDFLAAMADANETDISAFARWYEQAGTPQLKVKTAYDAAAKTFTLTCSQVTKPTPGQPDKPAMLLPIKVGLLGSDGADLPLTLDSDAEPGTETTRVLRMETAEATFTFTGIEDKPVPSILRGFSAPVQLSTDLTSEELVFLLANDSDPFNRWEAGQTLARSLMLKLIADKAKGEALVMDPALIEAFRSVLVGAFEPEADKSFIARALALPGAGELIELVDEADPVAVYEVRSFVRRALAEGLETELTKALAENTAEAYSREPAARAARSLKNAALTLLSALERPAHAADCLARFRAADNMTDQLAALGALSDWDCEERTSALAEFASQWEAEPLTMNKWLSCQSTSNLPGNLDKVLELTEHPAFVFENPNKVYALIGGFASSLVNFHKSDGSGYAFLADMILKLDGINPQVASRMTNPFTRWRSYDSARQALMKAQLERIVATEGLSENTFELASKSLKA